MPTTHSPDPPNPQGSHNPFVPPLEDGMTNVRNATVIEPDGGVQKHGNWDDVVQNMSKGAPNNKPGSLPEEKPPADIWDKHIKTDQEKHAEEQQAVPDIPIIKHKGAEPADTTPITPLAEESRLPTPGSVPAPTAQPPVQRPATVTDKMDEHTKPTLQIISPPEKKTKPEQTSNIVDTAAKSLSKKHEKEVQGKLTTRLAHFGEAAVDAAVLPLVSTDDITTQLLIDGIDTADETTTQIEHEDSSSTGSDPAGSSDDEAATKNMTLTEKVMRQYGIQAGEAVARVHEAVKKINAASQNTGGGEVARIIEGEQGGEETVGVYIDVNGGKVLSMNPDDVIAALGRFLA